MNQVFADTSFYIAVASPSDQSHAKAAEWMRGYSGSVITSDFVIVELANFFCRVPNRATFQAIHDYLMADARVVVVPASRGLLDRGMDLYRQRPDKSWSLTDCISFVIMHDFGIQGAATTDEHFAQAGFVPLLV